MTFVVCIALALCAGIAFADTKVKADTQYRAQGPAPNTTEGGCGLKFPSDKLRSLSAAMLYAGHAPEVGWRDIRVLMAFEDTAGPGTTSPHTVGRFGYHSTVFHPATKLPGGSYLEAVHAPFKVGWTPTEI